MCTAADVLSPLHMPARANASTIPAIFHVEGRRQESFDDRVCRRLRNAKTIFPLNPTIIGGASVL
jgi:hypothetical protein